MIKHREAISMNEALAYINKNEEKGKEMVGFVKKFVKLNEKDAKGLKEKLEALNLIKLKKEDVCKIIEIFPENAEELNKIFTELSLDEDETKKILDTLKE